MFKKLRLLLSQFLGKTSKIKSEPLNKVSLIVIVLVDIFILVNVFTGLNDISSWHLSPTQAYPCYNQWSDYRITSNPDKYGIISASITNSPDRQFSFRRNVQEVEAGHLGKVSTLCLDYADRQDKVNSDNNKKVRSQLDLHLREIDVLEQSNRSIREQYDSTLLEKIAGQDQKRSLNKVTAEKAKQVQDKNNLKISTLEGEIGKLKSTLIAKPESINLITLLQDSRKFEEVQQGYQQASFWYPTIVIGLQAVFLLPLIMIALSVHNWAQRKSYGLVALISWHLLVIFCIPLIIKVFEFLQVGVIAKFVFNIVSEIFGGLLFLVSYVYIFLIPLVGFGLIKIFQRRVTANSKGQASIRVQRSSCIQCARKIQLVDPYCPHCGYYQYTECQNCHELTYKHLDYCRHCGFETESGHEQHSTGGTGVESQGELPETMGGE
jgi:predicted RNA-binding Zn-ribbon protein involved in translation (DUF1610 family)